MFGIKFVKMKMSFLSNVKYQYCHRPKKSLIGQALKIIIQLMIKKAFLKIVTNTGSCRFYRVVEFASYSDLKNALEKLSGKEMNGRKIKLIEAAKKR